MGHSRPIPKSASSVRCPVCGAPAAAAVRPFCSTRCADVDLARWLRGAYVIPDGEQDADEDGEATRAAKGNGSNSGQE